MISKILGDVKVSLHKFIKNRGLCKVILGVFAYLLLLGVYMQPVIANGCDTTYLGGPGDQSAFSWLYEASPNSPPLWGSTTWSNAPFGENLSEPFYITGLAQYSAVWAMEKVVSPTCAFNIYAAFGHVFTATVMFVFILWLIKRKNYFIAWFAGYLVAFSPYLQLKTTHHVSYVYSGLLILILWLLLVYWRKPLIKTAVGISILGALLFYHDPYFIMLAIFLCVAFVIGLVAYHYFYSPITKRDLWSKIRYLVFALPVFFILISPVIYTRLAQSAQIEAVVGSSRDTNIMDEGRAYSARPWEFVLPATTSPFSPDAVRTFQNTHQHGTDNIESTLFLGYTSIALALYYVIYWVIKGRKNRGRTSQEHQQTTLIAGTLTLVGGLMSLPPYIHVGALTLYFPSWILLSITTMWRMPARFFVILQIGLVILAVMGFLYLLNRYRKYLRRTTIYLIYILLLMVSFIEFLSFNPLDRTYWSQSMIPSLYTDIKNDPSIDRIAEYPMLDPPRNFSFIFYLSYQAYHEKPMINSAKAHSPSKKYRESMADLYDWQTPGALKQLGVDKVVVHGENSVTVDSPAFTDKKISYDNQTRNPVTSYSIASEVTPKVYLLAIDDGFDGPSNYNYWDIDYYMHQYGVIKPTLLPGAKKKENAVARIEFYAFEKKPRKVKFMQGSKTLVSVSPTESKQIVEFSFNPSIPIRILPDNAPKDYSFVISNMEAK